MAARKRRFNTDEVRQKIRAGHLVRRMQHHIDGKIELSMAQVRAIDILLRKIIPDLVQNNVTAEIEHKYVVEVPPLLTKDEWSKKYRPPQLPPPPTLELDPLEELPTLLPPNNTKQ
jgi:hypothetical protein